MALGDRPLPGVEFEELVAGAAATTAGQRRWALLGLAVMTGIACLGFGSRWLELPPDSARIVDAVVSPAPSSLAVSATPAAANAVAAANAAASSRDVAGLPLGFGAVAITDPDGRRFGGLLVVGFVPGRQTVSLGVIDGDGSPLAAAEVVSDPPAGDGELAGALAFSFESLLVPLALNDGSREGPLLEVRWTAADGTLGSCSLPLARAAGSSKGLIPLEPIALYARCS